MRNVIAELGSRPLSVGAQFRVGQHESRALDLVISDTTSALFAPVP